MFHIFTVSPYVVLCPFLATAGLTLGRNLQRTPFDTACVIPSIHTRKLSTDVYLSPSGFSTKIRYGQKSSRQKQIEIEMHLGGITWNAIWG
jgi:hypothetical protein